MMFIYMILTVLLIGFMGIGYILLSPDRTLGEYEKARRLMRRHWN
jgi:hypothetical protein